jgi:hypothetical protein
MKLASVAWMLILLAALSLLFVATFADDSSAIGRAAIMVGCSNVVQTRGGTICLDKAYTR